MIRFAYYKLFTTQEENTWTLLILNKIELSRLFSVTVVTVETGKSLILSFQFKLPSSFSFSSEFGVMGSNYSRAVT